MHCVFHSIVDHLAYLDSQVRPVRVCEFDWAIYWTVRVMAQGQQERPTSGVIVPAIYRLIMTGRDLGLRIQHRVCDKGHYIDEAEKTLNPVGVAIARTTDYGEFVETITLQPAVYLCLAGHHANFAEVVPQEGGVLMALQFYQSENHG